MPPAFINLPNEILLLIGEDLQARDLLSLICVSRHISVLFYPRLRGLALKEENNHAVIYWALVSRNRVALKRVLEEGENVRILTCSKTVVHRSPKKCSEWILAWMLNGRSDIFLDEPGARKKSGTAVSWAIRTSHLAVLRLLLDRHEIDRHSIIQALTAAIVHGNRKAVELLIDRTSRLIPNCQKAFSTPLEIAISNNHISFVKLLLESGADINARSAFSPYRGPFFRIAEEKGHMELAALLVEKHIRLDVNFADSIGQRSALYLAVQFSNEDLVRYVLKEGASVDIDPQDPSGNSPLKLALQREDKAILGLLAQHGSIDYRKIPHKIVPTTLQGNLS